MGGQSLSYLLPHEVRPPLNRLAQGHALWCDVDACKPGLDIPVAESLS